MLYVAVPLIVGVLMFGGVAHEFIPHEQAHGDDGALAGIMHASLRHEDKKAIITLAPIVLYLMVLMVSMGVISSRWYITQTRSALADAPQALLLRRGVIAYRRFG